MDSLISNPLVLIVGGILVFFLVVGILKHVLKMVALLALCVVACVGYWHVTGREMPSDPNQLGQSVAEQLSKTRDSAQEAILDGLRSAGDKALDRMEDSVADGFTRYQR